ncbi:MAG: PAS domain-containing protein [Nitrospira sp.]|nr:PAS domain-containing protein [Nitrospira sp.]
MAKAKQSAKRRPMTVNTKELTLKLAAINQTQAVIEFNMDGTVITANENFLKTLGYTLDEIKGHHHRIFCDPAWTSTSEYTAFWQKLNRNESDMGVYRRIGKGGKEVWMQAAYCPVTDEMGRPFKTEGGFKFQVQRVNDDATAPRLPGASQR